MEFFSSFYASEYHEALFEEFCRELPQASEETNSQLDSPLQLNERHAALQSMQGWFKS